MRDLDCTWQIRFGACAGISGDRATFTLRLAAVMLATEAMGNR